eukprot:scaffold138306_cov84-Cyclotella_meneghiniana.AAC.2
MSKNQNSGNGAPLYTAVMGVSGQLRGETTKLTFGTLGCPPKMSSRRVKGWQWCSHSFFSEESSHLHTWALLPVLSPLSIQVSVIGIGQGEHCIIPEIYFCHQEHPFVFPYIMISPSSFHRGVFHLLCHGPLMVKFEYTRKFLSRSPSDRVRCRSGCSARLDMRIHSRCLSYVPLGVRVKYATTVPQIVSIERLPELPTPPTTRQSSRAT